MKRALFFITVAALFITSCTYKSSIPEEGEEWDLDMIDLTDFGVFSDRSETERIEYTLLVGTEEELTVYQITGRDPGSSVYIVGGIHGDEPAGWYAAYLLRQANISAGTVYIISPANRYGAEHDRRTTRSDRDLNRHFPGDSEGTDADVIAAAIFGDIGEKSPDLVLDLHEAHYREGGTVDALGNSIIVSDMTEIGNLVLDILTESERGDIFSSPLTLYGSPPEGSINREVSERLGIPVITVETLRTDPIAVRVKNHLQLAEFILKRYGMCE